MIRKIILAALLVATPAAAQVQFSQPGSALSQDTATPDSGIVIVGAHNLTGFTAVVNAPNGGFILGFGGATIPADGVVSPDGCWVVPASVPPTPASMVSMANTPEPIPIPNGIVLVFSTGADCFHLVKTGGVYFNTLFQ